MSLKKVNKSDDNLQRIGQIRKKTKHPYTELRLNAYSKRGQRRRNPMSKTLFHGPHTLKMAELPVPAATTKTTNVV